jgi:hypothetical protein
MLCAAQCKKVATDVDISHDGDLLQRDNRGTIEAAQAGKGRLPHEAIKAAWGSIPARTAFRATIGCARVCR